MFEIKNIKFKGILDIEHLIIPEEKITSIVGESGSGKTTLLKMLNNIISPEEGEILYKEKNINDFDAIELRRKITMLPQNPVIYKGNILDNILVGKKFAKSTDYDIEEIKKLMMEFSIGKDLNSPADNLSGGEKQRLCIIRVLIMNPDVILLDEPSSALDEKTEDKVISYICNYVKQNNKTLVMVTHSSEIAKKYSDHIIEINKRS
ncbi:putative ABC transport system ATP-binding protein [Caloramator quimbayensis]|uniref:Putative ABC transport system ATP-binding protein n=1 Tax=Caloramator quimbayensis TaxID=1147123 RepID=A0A1T4Y8Z9_9CLOT|nr:ABC transporter ATP-binding protein [Caloramator quimbayensis]SKA98324.1 putative ABC transport system ATP-binding protein [Caloramator quimbayensis]